MRATSVIVPLVGGVLLFSGAATAQQLPGPITPAQQIGGAQTPPQLPPGQVGALPPDIPPEIVQQILGNAKQVQNENAEFRDKIAGLAATGGLVQGAPGGAGSYGNVAGMLQQIGEIQSANNVLQSLNQQKMSGLGKIDPLSKQSDLEKQKQAEAGKEAEGDHGDATEQAQQEIQQAIDEMLKQIIEFLGELQQTQNEQRQQVVRAGLPGNLPGSAPHKPFSAEEAKLIEQAKDETEPEEPDGPAWLKDYPYVANGEVSPSLPDIAHLPLNYAFYQGRIAGTAGDGSQLDGDVYFGFGRDDDDYTVGGSLNFGDEGIEFTGSVTDADKASFAGGFDSSDLFGGRVEEPGGVEGAFYGPNAEQVGANWFFDVTGGGKAGRASGMFAGGQVDSD